MIPYDMVENLYWGKEWQLGYSKHPPLFAWINYAFYELCGRIPESSYILTQLNLLVGLIFIYKVSDLIFNDEKKSFSAVLIALCSSALSIGNEKFNATTILISLFPAMFYFFMCMIKFREKSSAIWFGIVAVMAFISKYFSLLYLGCFGLFVLIDKEARKLLKISLPYISAIVFLIGISWHVVWILENDFVTIKYGLEKSIEGTDGRVCSFKFLLMQFLFFGTSFLAVIYSLKDKINFVSSKLTSLEKFTIFITVIPNVILFFASFLFGMQIGSFWGMNMGLLLGTSLIILNPKIDVERLFHFTKIITLIFAMYIFLKLMVPNFFMREQLPYNAINVRNVVEKIEDDWRKNIGNEKIKFTKTNKKLACLHAYLKDNPRHYDPQKLRMYDLFEGYPYNKKGLVAIFDEKDSQQIRDVKNFYGTSIIFENTINVINQYVIYYAFIEVNHE